MTKIMMCYQQNARCFSAIIAIVTAMCAVGCDENAYQRKTSLPQPCLPPEEEIGEVRIHTDCTSYEPGDSIRVVLINESDISYMYGPCGMTLNKLSNRAWIPVSGCSFGLTSVDVGQAVSDNYEVACDVCQSFAHIASPDGEARIGLILNNYLGTGAYRVIADVSPDHIDGEYPDSVIDPDKPERLVSNIFFIE